MGESRIFIKPAVPGNVVRHPKKLNYVIKQEGEYVVNHREWRRMLKQGDIVLATPPTESTPEPNKEKLEKPTVKTKDKLNKEGVE